MSDTQAMNGFAARLRDHPVARGSGNTQTLDIATALELLRAETHPAVHGHRQVTLFHQPPVTLVLFAFDAEGLLPDHRAQGMVSIQVIDGAIAVQAAGSDYILETGQILVLNPGIAQSVRATLPSAMLLTVHQVEAGRPDSTGRSD